MSKEVTQEVQKRVIPLSKAIKIMKDYKKNNFNAFKTLLDNGYSESYAHANARYTIQACSDRIKESLAITNDDTSKEVANTVTDLYATVGLSKEEVLNELVKIIKQDLNYAVKLRALEPFVRQEGIKWDEKETQQAQAVQIVLKEKDIDSQNTLNPSHEAE